MAKRLALIVNSISGKCRSPQIVEEIQPAFRSAGFDATVYRTEYRGHARDLAQTLPLEDLYALCVVGGDGTIHEVINGVLNRGNESDVRLGIIPAGSGNSVSLDCGITSPLAGVQRILDGKVRDIDVAQVTTENEVRFCINVVGWGAAVEINQFAERIRRLGPTRYAIAAGLHILRAKGRRVQLTLDASDIDDDFQMIVACNTQFTGKAMRLAPRADMSDGKIDVVLVRRATRGQLLRLFRDVYTGQHLNLPCVEYRQVASLRLACPEPQPLNLDGELTGQTPVTLEVLPGRLNVFA